MEKDDKVMKNMPLLHWLLTDKMVLFCYDV